MNLLVKVDNPETGMYYHRLFSPFNKMAADKHAEVSLTESRKDEKTGGYQSVLVQYLPKEVLSQFEAVVFSRSISLSGETKKVVDHVHDCGAKVVLDIDDYWNLDKSHYLYKAHKKDKLAEQTEEAIKLADLVITPTPYLTEECKKLNENSHTVKTAIDPTHEQWSTASISSPLTRFGWVGGIHHKPDVAILTNAFNEVHSTLSDYQLCLGGFSCQKVPYQFKKGNKLYKGEGLTNGYYYELEKNFTNNYKAIDEDYEKWLKEFSPTLPDHVSYFKPYRRLWTKSIFEYGTLYDNVDVSLVPLSGLGQFNQYKSDLKLIEAGTKGKMAIVSKVKPYTLVPEDVVHFVEPGDMGGWYKAIKYCLENKNYVKEMGERLREYVKENYDLDKENKLRYELIKNIINK